MSSKTPCKVVFIGNIPYDLTETQILDIFNTVGPVVSFRMVFDRETGKPRGYGFLTYPDAEIASSAVRNLNNYDVGGRTLRVDFADAPDESGDKIMKKPNASAPTNVAPPPTSVQSTEAIQSTMASMSPSQLLEYLSVLKMYALQSPDHCRLLLQQNPQLVYALFQALVVMNVVDSTVMQQIIQGGGGVQATPSFIPIMAPPPLQVPMMGQPNPMMMAPPSQMSQQEQQKQLLMQVLQLTPEQIQSLPPDQRQQVIDLRAQILGQSNQ